MNTLHAVILSIVEGFTEYLPISSTGHMIVTSWFLGINDDAFTKDFTVIVQFGAILAVVVLYWRRFLSGTRFYRQLFVGFLPAAVIGLVVKNKIDALLGSVTIVAVSFILGGIVLLFVDRWFADERNTRSEDELTYPQAAFVGFCQCMAFIPGVSRSAATMIGALSQRLTRKAAAEFSFHLAVPTLTGATFLKLLKIYKNIQPEQIQIILVGNAIAFVVALLTIKAFIGILSRHGFKVFGYYRIAFGVLLLAMMAAGMNLKMD